MILFYLCIYLFDLQESIGVAIHRAIVRHLPRLRLRTIVRKIVVQINNCLEFRWIIVRIDNNYSKTRINILRTIEHSGLGTSKLSV